MPRLATTLYAYAFLDEFVLVYPLYTLLFARTGLSAGRISSLFVVWGLTTLALEVPSGAWADAVSRRALLVLAPLLGALGFGLWVFAPSYPAFAVGFMLWGAKGALVSGALEALVYEELEHEGAQAGFARVWGRAQGWGVVAVLVATVLAAPVVSTGGYPAIGLGSVAAGVACAVVALAFPEHLGRDPDAEDAGPGYLATIRAGWSVVRADAAVRRAVLLVPAVGAIWGALEEYTPLLAGADGATEVQVPWWQAVLWAGVTVGGLVAGRVRSLDDRAFALVVVVAAGTLVAGAGSGRAAGLLLVAVAFGLLQFGGVVAQTRVQNAVTGPARATVTSLAALGEETIAIGVFVVYGGLAGFGGDRTAFVVLGSVYLAVAAWLLPARPGVRP